MKITMPVTLTASDAESRIIAGRIVQWDSVGNTSAGQTVFLPNSITFSKNTKLVLEHEMTKPIGKLMEWSQDETGITASFKIAKTTAGNDALEEAATGLRSDFSVGVKVDAWDNQDGVMAISASKLIEVSLVTEGAIPGAEVEKVAAAETQGQAASESTPEPQIEEPKTEGDDLVSETVSEAVSTEAVEAAKSEVTAATTRPVYFTNPRVNLNVSAGEYAKAQLAASRGDADARDLVAALAVATVAENTGMVPPTYLRDVIGIIDSSRPFIDSIESAALPSSGMKVFTPKLGAQATVALTAEGAEFSSTDTAVTFQEDNVVKFAGAGILDVELIDRSDPAFLDLYIRELAASYAQKTDAYAANIAAQNSQPSDGTTTYKAIAKAIADSFGVMRMTPDRLLVANSGGEDDIDFAGLLGAVDGSQRPLFAAAAPQNAGGLITQGSTAGSVAGLSLVVDPNYTGNNAGAKYALVYPSNAMRFHESAQIQLRTNVVSNGQLEIGLYGYACVVNRYPTAFRYLTVTP
jgi:HK97 family phage prohead protease